MATPLSTPSALSEGDKRAADGRAAPAFLLHKHSGSSTQELLSETGSNLHCVLFVLLSFFKETK